MKINSAAAALRALGDGCLRPGGLELTRRALESAALAPGARILDLGCGPGASLGLLATMGFAASGLDRCPAYAREASGRAPVVLADMAAPPFAEEVFDGILCECVLSLSPVKKKVLAACARLLRPGGRLILSDLVLHPRNISTGNTAPGRQAPASQAPELCARGAVSAGELRSLLEEAGLTVILSEDRSRALKELAAQLVWQGQSLAALSGLWHTESMSKTAPGASGAGPDAALRPSEAGSHAARSSFEAGPDTACDPPGAKPDTACDPPGAKPGAACDPPGAKPGAAPGPRLGYLLLIAEKKGENHEGPRC